MKDVGTIAIVDVPVKQKVLVTIHKTRKGFGRLEGYKMVYDLSAVIEGHRFSQSYIANEDPENINSYYTEFEAVGDFRRLLERKASELH